MSTTSHDARSMRSSRTGASSGGGTSACGSGDTTPRTPRPRASSSARRVPAPPVLVEQVRDHGASPSRRAPRHRHQRSLSPAPTVLLSPDPFACTPPATAVSALAAAAAHANSPALSSSPSLPHFDFEGAEPAARHSGFSEETHAALATPPAAALALRREPYDASLASHASGLLVSPAKPARSPLPRYSPELEPALSPPPPPRAQPPSYTTCEVSEKSLESTDMRVNPDQRVVMELRRRFRIRLVLSGITLTLLVAAVVVVVVVLKRT